jgi:predicted MFS family arabinose efflux permease
MKKQYFIFACIFFFGLGANILNFSLVYRLTDWFSLNPGQIGTYIALGQVFYFLGCILYYRFGSHFSPAPVLSFFAALIFLASLPLGHSRIRFLVYASYWAYQFATALYLPPLMAWLAEGLPSRELAGKISVFNRAWMAANILGPLIAGNLYRWNSTGNFLLINLCFSLVLLLLFFMKIHSKKLNIEIEFSFINKQEAQVGGGQEPVTIKEPDKKLGLYRYKGWIAVGCSAMFMGVLVNIIPIHIRDGLGFTERTAGTILFIRCTAGFVSLTLLGKFTGWHFNRNWFLFLLSGLMLCTLVLLFAGSQLPIFYAATIIYGLTHSGCYNGNMFYSSATGKSPKKNLALGEMFICLGCGLGSAGGGILYQHFSLTGTCLALILVFGMGAGFLILLDHAK